MKKIVFVMTIFALAASCNPDHKKETISNYVQYVWRRQPGEYTIDKLEEVKSITGKDSLDLLIKEYAKGINPTPTVDTIINRIERDIDYNSILLAETNLSIDSLNENQPKKPSNDDFFKSYLKILTERRDFISQQVDELKYYRSALKKYNKKKDDVFGYEVLCEYKLKGHAPDTVSKMIKQTFFLSPDTRRVLLVK